jgi:hypothetical protein
MLAEQPAEMLERRKIGLERLPALERGPRSQARPGTGTPSRGSVDRKVTSPPPPSSDSSRKPKIARSLANAETGVSPVDTTSRVTGTIAPLAARAANASKVMATGAATR